MKNTFRLNRKQFLFLVITVITLWLFFSVAWAAQIDGGSWGDLAWGLDESYTLTIYGSGSMNDFNYNVHGELKAWQPYNSIIETIVIDDGITNISEDAFYNTSRLTRIDIPDSVTCIGPSAFAFSGIEDIILPPSVISIGDWAFYTSNITSIIIPGRVTYIGEYAFDSCTNLTNVFIPASVSVFGESVFSTEQNQILIVFPESAALNYAKANSLQYRIVKALILPEEVTTIETEAFAGNDSEAVIIPEGCGTIGARAFANSIKLIYVYIPSGITMAADAFSGCDKVYLDYIK